MNELKVSVIVPTHNRHEKLAETLASLRNQSLSAGEYEIVVVDDGSCPAVTLVYAGAGPKCTLVRLEGVERSAARNAGAAPATGGLIVFVDDDNTVGSDFLAAHLRAQYEWADALAVGAVRLPPEVLATPFGRFRHALEQNFMPGTRGPTGMRNSCSAGNMSISRMRFDQLGGFDSNIVSSEDQDFALRHTASGGQIVYIPEARAIHHDSALNIRSYCRRSEWGMENMIPFCERYPDWPDNIERNLVNGPVLWRNDSFWRIARKLAKRSLTPKPILAALFLVASLLERLAPNSRLLDRTYRLLLGAHILRGYRAGVRRHNPVAKLSDPMTRSVASDSAAR